MQRFERFLKAGVLLLLLLACTIVSAETNTVNTIDVTGTQTIKVEPDQAEISLAVITMGTNIEEIQRENALKMTSIISALKSEFGLSDKEISTSSYSISEEKYLSDDVRAMYQKGAQIYRVSNRIDVISGDTSNAGSIIDLAVKNGANSVNSLQFSLTDTSRRQYKEKILQMAVEKATDEANIVVQALGMTLGKPAHIQIGQSDIIPYRNYAYAESMMAYDAAAPTPIQAEEVEISASVSISFTIS
ncbi:MAG: SIMPL domain-containing protein [Methanomicrobiales archaeon]|jgi:uncharacterized protein YggE|nr:SIMPL domain-containing protein [Methanomicrobiales archaeon]